MPRISKPPEVRKKEILDTAMRVFYEKGYEAASMADIAKEMKVVQGLCYRYFTSKQELFECAMQQYVMECCEGFLSIIHNRSKTMGERMDEMYSAMQKEENSRYHNFYHKPGNENLHEQLTLKMCKYMIPHVSEELNELCKSGKLKIENPEVAAQFLIYGQISLWQPQGTSFEDRCRQIRKFIDSVLNIGQ